MIKINEIEKLAALSRISVSREEREMFARDMASILNYVEQIKEATEATEAAGNSETDDGLANTLREDAHHHDVGKFTEDLLVAAPEREKGYVKVKKIF